MSDSIKTLLWYSLYKQLRLDFTEVTCISGKAMTEKLFGYKPFAHITNMRRSLKNCLEF